MGTAPATGAWARTAADLMRREVVTVSPEASLFQLADLLRKEGVHGVPVVEADGQVIGFAGASDLLWLLDQLLGATPDGTTSRKALDTTVREVMTPDVFRVEPDTSLDALCRFFQRTGVHRALVMEDGELLGVVSLSDLLVLVAERGERGDV